MLIIKIFLFFYFYIFASSDPLQELAHKSLDIINFVNYTKLYIEASNERCIHTENSLPIYGALVNHPKVMDCDTPYNIGTNNINLPGNTLAMCSFDPNWIHLNGYQYYTLSKIQMKAVASVANPIYTKCLSDLPSFTTLNNKDTVYGINTYDYVCSRLAAFEGFDYGKGENVLLITPKVEKMWQQAGIEKSLINFYSRITIAHICIGVNSDGCKLLWNTILKQQDNSILSIFGKEISSKSSSWIYADGVDIQMLYIIGKMRGIGLSMIQSNPIKIYHMSKNYSIGSEVWGAGLVGGFP